MKFALTIFILAFPLFAWSAPDYRGKWKSSSELSSEFNEPNEPRLNEDQWRFFREFFGHITVEYGEKIVTVYEEKRTYTLNGKQETSDAAEHVYQYEYVAEDDTKVVLRQKGEDGVWQLEILHFVNENTYWVYVGSDPKLSFMNIREYFVRVE